MVSRGLKWFWNVLGLGRWTTIAYSSTESDEDDNDDDKYDNDVFNLYT